MKIFLILIVYLILIFDNCNAQIELDVRNDWLGEYNGTVDFWGQGHGEVEGWNIRIHVNNQSRRSTPPMITYGTSRRMINIYLFLTDEHMEADNLTVSENEIIIKPSLVHPYEVHITREQAAFGETVLRGEIKFYRLDSGGNASITYNLKQFFAATK